MKFNCLGCGRVVRTLLPLQRVISWGGDRTAAFNRLPQSFAGGLCGECLAESVLNGRHPLRHGLRLSQIQIL